jgi:hypothetical protein
MLAMDTPGASERALGVTRLQRCGHYFCRKEYVFIRPNPGLCAAQPTSCSIAKWILEGVSQRQSIIESLDSDRRVRMIYARTVGLLI